MDHTDDSLAGMETLRNQEMHVTKPTFHGDENFIMRGVVREVMHGWLAGWGGGGRGR